MTKFYIFDIYNISIIIKACGEVEVYQAEYLSDIVQKERITVYDICKWCKRHNITYGMKFKFYKYADKSIRRNIKSFLSYKLLQKTLDSIEGWEYHI